MFRYSCAAFLFLPIAQCAPYGAAWNTGRTDAQAENTIMLVNEEPESLGYKRLRYATELHPEFTELLQQIGKPDCIAETTHGDRHYMILYQIDQRRAFSCRSHPYRNSDPVQVSGPYPITQNEYKTLRDLKKRAAGSFQKPR
jgi:hypothetical protein